VARLDGVRALVTGATNGLGYAMVEALLREGASVFVGGRPGGPLEAVVANWGAQGLAAAPLAFDVRDSAAVAAAAAQVPDDGLDLLVNNAGIGMRTVNPRFMEDPRSFWEVSPEGFADVIATNLTGYFLVARAFAPRLVAQGRGRIVNVTVNRSTMERRGFVPYGPSRAGAEALSLIMTEDLRPHGVTVNLLAPGGATLTGMIPESAPSSVRERLLPPSVMGPPIVFLASDEAEGLTGARILANEWDAWLAEFRGRTSPPG
jgi:NAD(P)-dependent dehydrogenase (short-subunit alcohol dehydrogenase family)